MRNALICLTFFAGLISCKKENLDINAYWQCNKSQNLDTTAISNKLIGSWRWVKHSCFSKGNTTQADQNVKVTFRGDHSFSVNDHSNTLTQGIWNLIQVDGNSWGLHMSSASEILYGRILFCGNEVLFNDSYIDGCDNLFNQE